MLVFKSLHILCVVTAVTTLVGMEMFIGLATTAEPASCRRTWSMSRRRVSSSISRGRQRPGRTIGLPCGVVRAASAHAS